MNAELIMLKLSMKLHNQMFPKTKDVTQLFWLIISACLLRHDCTEVVVEMLLMEGNCSINFFWPISETVITSLIYHPNHSFSITLAIKTAFRSKIDRFLLLLTTIIRKIVLRKFLFSIWEKNLLKQKIFLS